MINYNLRPYIFRRLFTKMRRESVAAVKQQPRPLTTATTNKMLMPVVVVVVVVLPNVLPNSS